MVCGIYINDLVAKVGETAPLGLVLLTHMQHEMTVEAQSTIERNGNYVQKHRSVTKRQYRLFTDDNILEPNVALVGFSHHAELISCDSLQVRHRRLNIGDPVKSHPRDAMSGTVLATTSTATLEPLGDYTLKNGTTVPGSALQAYDVPDSATFTGAASIDNIPVAALERSESINANTLLIYKDWIGLVDDVQASVSIRLCNGTVVELLPKLLDEGTFKEDMHHVGDFVNSKKANLRQGNWIFGQYNPNVPPCGTVVRVRNREVEVRWLYRRPGCSTPEPPHVLERLELDSLDLQVYSWTPKPTTLATSPRASHFENDIAKWMRVKFQDAATAQQLIPAQYIPRTTTNGFDINVFDVSSLKSLVRILWQDGTTTETDSLNLCIEERSLHDDHIAWVGEVAHSVISTTVLDQHNVSSPARVGIVQAVDATARTAQLQWCPLATIHYLAMDDELENEKQLILHRIGVADGPVELVSLYDIVAPPELNLSRGDLVMLDTAAQAELSGMEGITWIGTVVDEYLTGELLIRLSAAVPVCDIVLRREQIICAIRFDELTKPTIVSDDEMMSDSIDLDDMDVDDSEESDDEGSNAIYEIQYDGEEAHEVESLDLNVDADDWESLDEEDSDEKLANEVRQSPNETIQQHSDVPMIDEAPAPEITTREPPAVDTTAAAYTMHEGQVPYDHRFLTSPASDDNIRASRLQKEHRILQRPGSLPEGVYVHAWDARLDLLRVLFIGPSDTAYADCPFIIDFYLPENYPHSPPSAFFHSWAVRSGLGAVGKVNPNLYEDGKVCLSLLGTWEGERSERWTHASTLLQVVVSILGLVLVKEPYWNEPGFDAQMGTEEGQRQVMLYNERIVLRSLNFAIVAVEALQSSQHLSGTIGLRDQLSSLYVADASGHLLGRLKQRVSDTLARSETSSEADGLKVLSKGACIALSRVHTRLKELLAVAQEA